MKKKFKFHCVDDDSESYSESSEGEDESDDKEPEINVPSKVLNSNNLISKKYLSDYDHLTPPPPLPSSSPQSPSNDKKSDENEVDEDYPLQNINLNEESPPPPSLPDDLFINDDDDPPPPDVEEVENADDEEENNNDNTTSKDADEDKTYVKKRKRIPKSLKRKNKSMSREDEFIACTNRIYEYFDHKIPKLTILKAIHAKCGDYRLAILALAQDPSRFNSTSLFQSPEADPETIKKYLQL